MKAGVLIDSWKLSIFKQHLDKAKFSYTQYGDQTSKCLTLLVEFENVGDLAPVIKAANDEAARSKLH